MRLLASLCAGLSVALLLSQAGVAKVRSRGRSDGGVGASQKPILLGTDPPGRLRAEQPSADAGPRAAADAGPDDVHRELAALRGRVDQLERERAAARGDSQRLDQLAAEVRALRVQLGDADARKEAEGAERAAAKDQVAGALRGLSDAQEKLAGGSSAIDDELADAEAALTGEAQRDVQAAREALRNRDLSQTRAWLAAAARAAQQQR